MSLRRYNLFVAFPCALVVWAVVTAIALAAAPGEVNTVPAGALQKPEGAFVTADGTVFVADTLNHRIRKVAPNGAVTTVAGTGTAGVSGDLGLATSAKLSSPSAVSFDSGGHLLIADTGNHRIRHVDLVTGIISTEAGTGTSGFSGDGGSATNARLNRPQDVAGLPGGGFLVADESNGRVRKVSAGKISTVAGDGTEDAGGLGDGGPATQASLSSPNDVEPTADGGYLIADGGANRVRKVSPAGLIITAAGDGRSTTAGDGGSAAQASVHRPSSIGVTADGGFLIAEAAGNRIRRVGADGSIATVGGTGLLGFTGDGGPAVDARFHEPEGVAILNGAFLVVDTKNDRLRRVEAGSASVRPADPANPEPGTPPGGGPGTGGPAPSGGAGGTLPPPVERKAVQVVPVGGTVKIRKPGTKKFVDLRAGETIPMGSVIDTTEGIVRLTTAAPGLGRRTQTADFWRGIFAIRQAKDAQIPELGLRGAQEGCRAGSSRRKARASGRRRTVRKLWGSGKGKFRTRGRYGAATVRGTKWLTLDYCESTVVKVAEGLVAVRDLERHRTVMVRAGESHKTRRKGR